ncbi:MAG: gamma-glutamyl cyclotransferase, partial [Prosthecobacter sp.]|nr:gamma-glutamyl cyclotransferase [Prosthecobacter sp.]
ENHGWIKQQQFIAEACTQPQYRLYDLGGYPGMTRSADGISIQGEVWEVNEAGLTRLDILEDTEGGEYERVMIQLEGEFATQRVEGYVYLRGTEGRRDLGRCW